MSQKSRFFKQCIHDLKRHNPSISEDGYHELSARANEYIDELIEAFQDPANKQIVIDLLEIIGFSQSPKAVAVLAEQLRSESEGMQSWAIYGLKRIGTKETTSILKEARYFELSTAESTETLRKLLNEIIGPEEPWERFSRHTPLDSGNES